MLVKRHACCTTTSPFGPRLLVSHSEQGIVLLLVGCVMTESERLCCMLCSTVIRRHGAMSMRKWDKWES